MVRRAGFLASDRKLDVLCLVQCGLGARSTLIELNAVMSSEPTEAESRVAEIGFLEEFMSTTDVDAQALGMAHMCFGELAVEFASLAAWAEHAQAERDTFANRIRELKLDVVTHDGELGVVV